MNHPIKNEVGNRYGRLTVVVLSHKTRYGCQWLCKCDCGKEVVVGGVQLRNGRKRSCGCLEKERLRTFNEKMKANAKYKKPSKIYQAWANMKQRCFNKNALEYNSYGGRGITVCDDWVKSSASFEKWALENGYAEGLTLDRIDVDGNYEPSNCRWIDQRRQLRNKRDTIYIEYNGERKPLIDFCEELGVPYDRAFDRIRRGKTDSSEILSKDKLPFILTEEGRKRRVEASYVPYSLEKDGVVHNFKSENDACIFLGLSKCSVSKAYCQGRKIHGYTIHKKEKDNVRS